MKFCSMSADLRCFQSVVVVEEEEEEWEEEEEDENKILLLLRKLQKSKENSQVFSRSSFV